MELDVRQKVVPGESLPHVAPRITLLELGDSHEEKDRQEEAMHRRQFLALSAAAGAEILSPTRLLARSQPARESVPRPCPPSAWRKHGIALEAGEPWEAGQLQNFTCPAEPLGTDRWRLWYSGIGGPYAIGYAEGVPGGEMKKVRAACSPGRAGDGPLTIGNLPEGWQPVQVVHLRLRSGRHRLYFWIHGPKVVRYLAAESDDGRRYRVLDPLRAVLYHPSDRAAWGVPSPDGVMAHDQPTSRPADEPPAPSRLISNDATNVYQLPDGSFEMYSVGLLRVPKDDPAYVAHDNAPGWIRVIDRYTSGDGLHFENRDRIIQRDAHDPVDQQFYYLAVTHTDRGRVGLIGHYRVQAQTMDLEWCFSKEGVSWERPLRSAWLPRGDQQQPDSYGIYAPHALVQHGGKWHLFYTAVNEAHNHKHSYGPRRALVMHATTDSIWAI